MMPNRLAALAWLGVVALIGARVVLPASRRAPVSRTISRVAPSVIVVDLEGDGVSLTSAKEGVPYPDSSSRSAPRWTGWTSPATEDAFLAIDSTRNGRVDGFQEMIGSLIGLGRSGFDYLRDEADGFATDEDWRRKPRARQKPDGVIDASDAIFQQLMLWSDLNHNGRSEESELQSLVYAGVKSINLNSRGLVETDPHGNMIRARSAATRLMPDRTVRAVDVMEIQFAEK